MHSAKTAHETLELLWHNYLELAEKVDLEAIDPEALGRYAESKQPVRPFRIAAWLGRQGYFVAAWGLWEYYSGKLCERLRKKLKRRKGESHVDWIRRSVKANDLEFPEPKWFTSANCLRNLIAHHGARAFGPRAKALFDRARVAFPDIKTYRDGYVAITHCEVAQLQLHIQGFIEDMAEHEPAQGGESAAVSSPPVS